MKGGNMSKTLKTRPLAVRILDMKDHTVGSKETHRHQKGHCDLPEHNIKALMEREDELNNGEYPYKRSESCTYDFAYTGVGICGCKLCTDQFGRKKGVRRTRHKMKSDLTAEAKKIRAAMNESGDITEDNMDEFDTPWISPKDFY